MFHVEHMPNNFSNTSITIHFLLTFGNIFVNYSFLGSAVHPPDLRFQMSVSLFFDFFLHHGLISEVNIYLINSKRKVRKIDFFPVLWYRL